MGHLGTSCRAFSALIAGLVVAVGILFIGIFAYGIVAVLARDFPTRAQDVLSPIFLVLVAYLAVSLAVHQAQRILREGGGSSEEATDE